MLCTCQILFWRPRVALTILYIEVFYFLFVDSSSAHEAPCVSNAGFVREEEGDLFRASRSTSLAHCVSSDMKMGAGIALLFR